MASDIAPAAVPGPGGQSSSDTHDTAPGKGVLGLLAPLEPARPTSAAFNLDPSTAATADGQALTSASSAAYQDDTPGKDDAASKAGGKQQNRVLRSFALAAIERWKKGGDARNKRLDIQKAKAQAYQTKESRTVNRSEKFVGGSANSGSGAGKSTDSKSKNSGGGGSNRSSRTNSSKSGAGSGKGGPGPKNSRTGSGTGSGGLGGSKSGGRSGSGGSSGSGGTGGGRGGSGTSGHGAGGHRGPGSTTTKKDKGGHGAAGTGKSGGGTPAKHNSGTGTGVRKETATCGDSSGITLTKDKKTKTPDPAASPKPSLKKTPAPAKPDQAATPTGKDTPRKTDTGTTGPKGDTGGTNTDLTKKASKTGKDKTGENTPAAGKAGDTTTPDKDTAAKTSTDKTPAAKDTPKKTDRTPIRTQPSREAGYRDGARTALLTGHVKAYRDGFKDGHRDTSQTADREKARLDQAHARRQQQRASDPKDQPVTASSTDYQPTGPHPIAVKEITAQQVTLEGGQTVSHGEVRSLKQYERRMRDKATSMGKAAEGTKTLKAVAEQQADQALKFVEMAKNVEGGERFIGVLNRLHEAATIQIREAEELHKRSLRGAESTNVVLTNVDIRYGGIYQAVIDSGLIAPAHLHWYRK